MKKRKKIRIAFLTAIILISSPLKSFACTGLYVGEDCSISGNTYYGRSEEIEDNYCKVFGVAKAKKWKKGSYYRTAHGFKISYPSSTYSYTYVKDAPVYGETVLDKKGKPVFEAYAEAGINEKGVSVSATVSTMCNEKAGEADPLIADTGIKEVAIGSVLLATSKTARAGVEYMAKILDKYGAGECNSFMIADHKETWYFEILTGHQYAATKLPKDFVSLQPNMTLLGVIDIHDKENVIVSKDLVSLAKKNGFLVTDKKGRINVAKTYGQYSFGEGECHRYLQGMYYLKGEKAKQHKNLNLSNVNLLVKPNRKLSTFEILRTFAYRGKGSGCDMDQGTASWALGNKNQVECHVFEIRKNLPEELATIQWQALSDAEFSVFIPHYSALIEKVNKKYNVNSDKYVENSLNWVFSEINAICYDYRSEKGHNLCGETITAYFERYQKSLIRQQKEVDIEIAKLYRQNKTEAKKMANLLAMDLAEQTYYMADSVLKELNVFIEKGEPKKAFVPSAMKNGLMPVYSVSHAKSYAGK